MDKYSVAILVISLIAASTGQRMPFKGCRGQATYVIRFFNAMNEGRFGPDVPALVFAPLTGVSHSNRLSLFTVRGYADKATATIAKTGDNKLFLKNAMTIKKKTEYVLSIESSEGLTLPMQSVNVSLTVDCMRPFVTILSMIAPSPDWIVQISNRNLYDLESRSFVSRLSGSLIAYDAGVDSGADFTDPGNATLDNPTRPPQNIAPLVEDETDPFMGRAVGRYVIQRIHDH